MDNNQSQQPQQPMAPVTQPIQAAYAPAGIEPPKKSKTWLWVLLGVLGTGLLFLGAMLFMAYPALQARAVATSYMDAIKANDDAALKKLSGEGTSAFTTNMSEKLKGASYDITSAKSKDSSYVVNFDVKGSSSVRNATVVVKKGMVDNFIVDSQGSSTSDSSEMPTLNTTATPCLTASDLKANGITHIEDESLGEKTFFTDLFFNADSTVYRSDNVASAELAKAAALYSSTRSKNYGFAVQGSVYQATSTAGGVQLAMERSQKVKDQLVSRGVAADKIVVLEPTNSAYDADAARNITVFLTVPASCKTDNL